ncbi:OmpA family protein [Neolewinella antarctica]|uniref:Peptidoglycan-associated lipoprotein n=1 Tax=Neolewinella antarctica TaxID=442734 RepID=A0ABX0XFZ9_9BACT|nr:OmpA family protein [Neolewinella antarctica]NJC27829.1 peptidoglycan-associated lipoprotein [Neolewinella antarctica]
MRYLLSTLLLITGFYAGELLAQPLAGSSNVEQLQIAADSARANQNWFVALENYEKLYDETDEDEYLPLRALMNLRLRDVASATRIYKQVFRRTEATDTTYNEHRFHYARALKMDAQYDEARTYFEQFRRLNTDERLEKFAALELDGIELYRDAPQETSEVALELLDKKVNSSFSEYSPVLTIDGNTLYFSTWKSTSAVEQDGEEDDFSRIFRAERDEEGTWSKPEALGKEVNRPGVITANPALSADGRRMYFNRLAMESHRVTEAKIYMSDAEDDGWKSGNPVSGINSDRYLVLQPAAGELFGREVMFFVSDMDGGFGGLDIYYANYEGEGRFGQAVNLGEQVNTFADDITPFYFDGTLYWSTDGRPTMGGKDLFYAGWDGNAWGDAKNMGVGFNSTVDDKSLSIYGEGLVGFMTSNREGGRSVKSKTCCDDIYGFEVASLYANLVVGLFSEGKEALTNGTVVLQPTRNGNKIGFGQTKTRDDGNRFDYGLELETEYIVVVSHPGYYSDSVEINTLGLEESKELQEIVFLKVDPNYDDGTGGDDVPVLDTIEIAEAVVLENILYDLDKSDILPAAEEDLRQLVQIMEQYPDMVIELGSHTDTRGVDSYNLGLSKRRSASARKWLIINGNIDGPRIKTQGYGETQPQVASGRLAERISFLSEGDVITDAFIASLGTEEQRELAHRLNRRTEFKVLEGPDEIIIRRDVIERRLETPERNSLPTAPTQKVAPKNPAPTPQTVRTLTPEKQVAPPEVNRFSSLFGQPDVSGLPVLKFDRREVDLGDVPHGESRTFTVNFTNRGAAPAKVMLISACDCTTITHDDAKTYQPGDSGTMKIVFDSTEKEEDETITIDIFLEQKDKKGVPIFEMVEYKYHLLGK